MNTKRILCTFGLIVSLGTVSQVKAQGTFALDEGFMPANQMEITSVEGIKMTFGGSDNYELDQWTEAVADALLSGFTARTQGNSQNPKDDEEKSYTPEAQNVPTHGTYYVFEPQYDGTVTIAVRINNNKNFYILEDGVPLEAYNGWKLDANTSATYDFKVKHGSKYYAFCTGSKMHFYGFTYETIGAQDPVTVLSNQLFDKVNALLFLLEDERYKDKESVHDLIYRAEDIQSAIDEGTVPADSASYALAIEQVDQIREYIFKLCDLIEELGLMGQTYAEFVESTEYPGKEAMMAAANAAINFDVNQKGLTQESLQGELAALRQAYIYYLCSQEENEEGYIDVTGIIQNPRFITDDGTYTYVGWKADNSNIGDYGPRENAGRPCWNSWSGNFSFMDIHQSIEGLPSGFYALRCSATTSNGQITTQHAYVTTSIGTAVSPVITPAGNIDQGLWDTQETERIYCMDGNLTIGYASTGTLGTGSIGWFCVTDFQLLYFGDVTDEELANMLDTSLSEAKDLVATMHFGGDRSTLKAAIDEAAKATGRNERFRYMNALETALLNARQSEAVFESLTAEGTLYAQIKMALATDDGAVYGAGLSIVTKAFDGVNDFIASEATSADVSNINDRLELALRDAKLYDVLTNHPETTDYTFLIRNADVSALSGWTIVHTSAHIDMSGEHYSGDPDRHYFDDWNETPGVLLTHIRQTVDIVPNGTYTLRCAVRTSGDKGAFVYAEADGERLLKRIELEKYTMGEDEFVDASNVYGSIWQEAVDAVEAGTATIEQEERAQVNGGTGYGWHWLTIEGIEVKDHQMTIGLTTDPQITGEQFNGTWFSVGDFTLTQTVAGDNGEWDSTLAVSRINSDVNAPTEYFSVSGQRISSTEASKGSGIYIMRRNGVTTKIWNHR